MKYKGIITGIFLITIAIVLIGFFSFKALNPKEFYSLFNSFGYLVENKIDKDYSSNNHLIAMKDDLPFNVEYYSFDDEIDAKNTYEKIKKSIRINKKETVSSLASKLIAESNNKYIVVSRIRNTIMYVLGDEEHKEQINSIFKNINY